MSPLLQSTAFTSIGYTGNGNICIGGSMHEVHLRIVKLAGLRSSWRTQSGCLLRAVIPFTGLPGGALQ